MASKLNGIDAKHGDCFKVFPEDLVIVTDKNDPLYDERVNLPVSEEQVLNVQAMGVKEPIVCTRRGEQIIVVNGRQRTRWAIEANKRLKKAGDPLIRVPMILEGGDEKKQLSIMVALNELRTDDPIMVKVRKMNTMIDRGCTDEECATAFGVTMTCIRQWKKINDCSTPVKKAVESGKIAASAAAKLADLEPEAQKKALEKAVEETAPGKRATIKKVTRAAKSEGKKSSKKKDDSDATDDASYISIKETKRVMKALFSKGDALNAQQYAFMTALQFVCGILEEKELPIIIPKEEEEELEVAESK